MKKKTSAPSSPKLLELKAMLKDEEKKSKVPPSIVKLPKACWFRNLSNSFPELHSFKISFHEGLRNAGLGYRLWRVKTIIKFLC